ncbi:MAG: tRNA pseudouridine(38-40) synthase TruA [Planctomycetaceae bacterium]|nr:tRNA pseudouridine(38-40) synthase TruA [Planctomycetaceae bacterium]
MRTFKLILAYDGTDFAGWQRQPGPRTLQGVFEEVLGRVTGAPVTVEASGRTDAGVHALGQVVSFSSETRLEPAVLERALNAELPDEMLVRKLVEAPAGFHARFDAIGKRYRYALQDGPQRNPFGRRYAWHCRHRLDAAAMHEAAQLLLGKHDFRSFETQWPNRETSVRTITDILVARRAGQGGDPFGPFSAGLHVEVAADGFLYNMVRAIVGTLVEVGRGAREMAWVAEVLAAQDRKAAGQTAPPEGLFLLHVDYPPEQTAATRNSQA